MTVSFEMLLPPPQRTEQDIMHNRMLEFYVEFGDIISTDDSPGRTKARIAALFSYAESQGLTGQAALYELRQLSNDLHWELLDTRRFGVFYRFVFFMCRERGQKNITVNCAVEAWRISLTGRFRLLDQWCAFVLSHRRHAITEDTWRQVLEFSRVVHEDLSNYDPEGAWPVLVDDFVDFMYRRTSCSCVMGMICTCQQQAAYDVLNSRTKSNILPGMTASAGSKRRRKDGGDEVLLTRHLKRLLL